MPCDAVEPLMKTRSAHTYPSRQVLDAKLLPKMLFQPYDSNPHEDVGNLLLNIAKTPVRCNFQRVSQTFCSDYQQKLLSDDLDTRRGICTFLSRREAGRRQEPLALGGGWQWPRGVTRPRCTLRRRRCSGVGLTANQDETGAGRNRLSFQTSGGFDPTSGPFNRRSGF